MSSKRQRKLAKRKRKQEKRQAETTGVRRPEPFSRGPSQGGPGIFDEFLAEEESSRKAIEDARACLLNDPNDVGALLVLAQVGASGPSEGIALLEQALAAADRKLRAQEGEDVFERERGFFWGFHETRPYMRTRCSLAVAQLHHGRIEEALGHFEALLELCPNDNMLIRCPLAGAAIEAGRLDVAERVIAQFADDGLCWLPWTQALLAFVGGGPDDARALEALQRACTANPHVVDLLTGVAPLEEPSSFGLGSPEEAAVYAVSATRAWASTRGALRWLHTQRELTGARVPRAILPRGLGERLRRLPRTGETWRVSWREMPGWIEEEQAQPWATLVLSSTGLVLTCDVTTRAPSAVEAFSLCTRAMLRPMAGEPPGRPAALEVDLALAPALAGPCAAIDVDVARAGDERLLDEVFSSLATSLRRGEETAFPAWTRRPGVSDAQVRGLCAAATEFHRRTPWHRVTDGEGFVLSPARGDEAAREIFGEARPCAVVMGAGGETYGLALYDSVEAARKAADWSSHGFPPPSTTLTYDPPGLHHDQDLERFDALACPLPGRDVLPLVFRVEGEDEHPVAATPRQLAQLEAALRLLPTVCEQGAQRAALRTRLEGKGEVRVAFKRLDLYPEDEDPTSDDLLSHRLEASGIILPEHEAAFEEIIWRLDRFFAAHPGLGSSGPCKAGAALLCSLVDSPIGSGYPRSWAAGVAYAWLRKIGALGRAVLASEVAEAFEVSRATATNKARAVDDALTSLSSAPQLF